MGLGMYKEHTFFFKLFDLCFKHFPDDILLNYFIAGNHSNICLKQYIINLIYKDF
jgi:hypothetical protein